MITFKMYTVIRCELRIHYAELQHPMSQWCDSVSIPHDISHQGILWQTSSLVFHPHSPENIRLPFLCHIRCLFSSNTLAFPQLVRLGYGFACIFLFLGWELRCWHETSFWENKIDIHIFKTNYCLHLATGSH